MARHDLRQDAIDELYVTAPAQFVERRAELVQAAKEAGDPSASKAIGELRRPTQSAWTVNQLVRADEGVMSELTDLARRMRSAERALDGAAMRDLSKERRQLVDTLAAQAFEVTGQADPSPGLRDEVAGTLEAAVADPDVAAQLETGALLRAAHWSGFGASGPALTAVPASSAQTSRSTLSGKGAGRRRATPSRRPDATARSAAGRERDRERQRQLAQARDRLAAAKRDQARQKQSADRLRREVETLRQRLDEARVQLREVEGALRTAERDRQTADRAVAKLLSDDR
jgi:hypothetical protein